MQSRRALRWYLVALAVLTWPGRPVSAQQVLFRFDGSQAGETLGAVVAGLADLDGDGLPEIGVSAPLARGEGHPEGRVVVYSGATGTELFQIDPLDPRGMCWAMASAGDVDGDEVPDILIGTPFSAPSKDSPPGLLYAAGRGVVYSGRTRDVLFIVDGEEQAAQLGRSVDGAGDIDGDSVPDILIGVPYATTGGGAEGGRAIVLSGRDRHAIQSFDGANAGDSLGWAVAGVGDIDGDRVPDVMIGAPTASPGGRAQAGSVFLHSGATGELIVRLDGPQPSDRFGYSLAIAPRTDDGTPELLIGAPGASPGGRASAGSVFVYSSATKELKFRFDGPESFAAFGTSVAGGADADGDGVGDVVVGAPAASPGGRAGAGSAFVFSGATGDFSFRFDGEARADALGFAVAATGDLDRDGRAEVIVGSPYSSPVGLDGAGSVFVLSLPSRVRR